MCYFPLSFHFPNVIFVDKHSENETVAKRKELETKVGTNLLTCFVGRIVPSKNIEDTIRLVGILNRRGVKLGCILVGGRQQKMLLLPKEHFM